MAHICMLQQQCGAHARMRAPPSAPDCAVAAPLQAGRLASNVATGTSHDQVAAQHGGRHFFGMPPKPQAATPANSWA